jgi:hypothetical protein
VMALLRAGGVAFDGGAFEVMTLASDNQLASLFRRGSDLRLFVLRARPDGAEAAIARGGGVPLVFATPPAANTAAGKVNPSAETGNAAAGKVNAAAGKVNAAAGTGNAAAAGSVNAAGPAAGDRPTQPAPASTQVRTSFGPLRRVQRSETARHRTFVTSDQRDADRVGARVEERRARTGQTFVVLHIARDFAAGVGKVSFLFGSGIILEPDFAQLQVLDGSNRIFRPTAIYADGPTLELAYEVPAGTKTLRLQDGDRTWPLSERIAQAR